MKALGGNRDTGDLEAFQDGNGGRIVVVFICIFAQSSRSASDLGRLLQQESTDASHKLQQEERRQPQIGRMSHAGKDDCGAGLAGPVIDDSSCTK